MTNDVIITIQSKKMKEVIKIKKNIEEWYPQSSNIPYAFTISTAG